MSEYLDLAPVEETHNLWGVLIRTHIYLNCVSVASWGHAAFALLYPQTDLTLPAYFIYLCSILFIGRDIHTQVYPTPKDWIKHGGSTVHLLITQGG